jgi:hypothetical protein
MIVMKRSLSRRTVLRGIGAAVSLPLLDAMVPALSAASRTAAKPVMRLGFLYVPNGFYLPNLHPKGAGGKDFELTPILKPLEPLRDKLVAITGLSNELANAANGGAPHTRCHASWLSGIMPNTWSGENAKTIDQYAADKLGADTPLRSLELTTDKTFGEGGGILENSTSWRTATQPLPHERNPRTVFERLFGEGGTAAERLERMRTSRSILDGVLDDWTRLQHRIGAGDRVVVGDYLDSVRDVEQRIQRAERQSASSDMPQTDMPAGVPEAFDDHIKLLLDLVVLGYQADITRVSCTQIARESSYRTYPEIGVPEGHHTVSHHMQGDPHLVAQNTKINAYHVSLVAYLAQKMHATQDGDGTLLDHAILMHGSGMGDGDKHTPINLAATLVGGGCGQLEGGRHLVYPMNTPAMNLGLSLLDKVGVELDRLADSTGRLAGV